VTTPQPTQGCTLWPLVPDCLPETWSPDPTKWTPLQRWSVEAAAGVLKRLTAGVYNLCPIVIRPCRRNCPPGPYRHLNDPLSLPWTPAMLDGKIYNIPCGVCREECGCGPIEEIVLDPFVADIIQVKVDGVLLPADAYRVDDYRKLVRVDGAKWPDCQHLDQPDTEAGTFSVTYWTGTVPDAGASFALTDLAVEWWKACQGKQCSLGENVRQVARQGITYDVDTVYESIREGRTGLKRVDMWIFSVNPHGLRRRLRVYSPDVVHGRRTTWPNGPSVTPPIGSGPLGSVWTITTPQTVWLIQHGLGFEPAGVRITDLADHEIRGEVTYPDTSTVRIEFAQPTSGRVRLS
jgi:hypothetical protein